MLGSSGSHSSRSFWISPERKDDLQNYSNKSTSFWFEHNFLDIKWNALAFYFFFLPGVNLSTSSSMSSSLRGSCLGPAVMIWRLILTFFLTTISLRRFFLRRYLTNEYAIASPDYLEIKRKVQFLALIRKMIISFIFR